MAAVLDVSCPNCGKELKVPAEFEGKRVKCKECQEVFPVKAPGKATKSPGKPVSKAAPAKAAAAPAAPVKEMTPDEKRRARFVDDDDDEDGKAPNPLSVIRESDVARCPDCAKELDPPEATVCVYCGFNNKTRVKAETKKVIAPSAADWMVHLAPGIIAVVIIAGLVVLDVVCAVNMREWMKDSVFEQDEVDMTGRKKMLVKPGAFSTMIIAISLGVIIPAVRFGFRRLVTEFSPEEKVKK